MITTPRFGRPTTIVAESADSAESLRAYASISIAFETTQRVDLSQEVLSADPPQLRTDPLPATIARDYDSLRNNHPRDWPARFDVRRWMFFAAYRSGVRVGGAIVIADDVSVDLLEGRSDRALLWDLRVTPDMRGYGIGSALLCAARSWAWARGFSAIEVETQDINVAACRLYSRHGFRLRAVKADAYPDLPDETQLMWSAELAGMAD